MARDEPDIVHTGSICDFDMRNKAKPVSRSAVTHNGDHICGWIGGMQRLRTRMEAGQSGFD